MKKIISSSKDLANEELNSKLKLYYNVIREVENTLGILNRTLASIYEQIDQFEEEIIDEWQLSDEVFQLFCDVQDEKLEINALNSAEFTAYFLFDIFEQNDSKIKLGKAGSKMLAREKKRRNR